MCFSNYRVSLLLALGRSAWVYDTLDGVGGRSVCMLLLTSPLAGVGTALLGVRVNTTAMDVLVIAYWPQSLKSS